MSSDVGPVTLQQLALAAGLDPSSIVSCVFYGYSYGAELVRSPAFQQPLAQPPTGVDPTIVFSLAPVSATQTPQQATSQSGTVDGLSEGQVHEILVSMERDWKAAVKAEKQAAGLHRQLIDMQMRLSNLNRDLGPEERLCCDRSDMDAWQEARRWLREAATRLSRYVREFDAGETVYAGKKQWFQQLYDQSIAPKQPFSGMVQARGEFEAYRKTLQHLVQSMTSAYQSAKQDGELRAQQVLNRIAAKISASRSGR
ncbi:hypothetical protein GC176_20305 [bacterium]|nr:hypothetical protein [bacterium]